MVSIITTLLFLVISTYCWFNLKNQVVYKEYKKDSMKVLTYISDALYDLGYTLDSVNPFKLKEI